MRWEDDGLVVVATRFDANRIGEFAIEVLGGAVIARQLHGEGARACSLD